jgi:hypothetical protein
MSLEQRLRSTLLDAGSRIDVATQQAAQPFTVAAPRKRRRFRPILAFVMSLAAVLALGLAGGWIGGSGDGASPTGVIWHRVEGPDFATMAASGPGGFVSAGWSAEQGVWLSSDGVSWSQSMLPVSDGMFIESILSTNDRWLIAGGNDEARPAWWSEDGQDWSQVEWPTALEGTIQTIASTGEYFFVLSRDAFGDGTTLWRSSDAEIWTEIPTGPVRANSGFLEGTPGGLVFRDEDELSISTDGTTWATATLTAPSEVGEGRVRVEAVESLGNRWLVFIEVERVGQVPALVVLSSVNGEVWELEGIPPFGQLEGLAAGIEATGTIGDRLVVIPDETPTSTQDDGTVVADGLVRNTGQIWSTSDGSEWALELSKDQHLFQVDGAIIDDQPIGIWVGRGSETEHTPDASVVVTTAAMPDEPLDPDGLEFQAEVTEDGTVTLEEFEQAAEHWKTCMEEHGVTDVEYTVDRTGGFSYSYASPSPDGDLENAIDNLCIESWVTQVATAFATQAGR